jgi:cyclic-di-GMP-binding protein
MAAENSFDIACKIDMQEVTNAIDQARRDITTRYDLKGAKNEITPEKMDIVLSSTDDMKLKAVLDILQSKLHRRGIDLKALTINDPEPGGGGVIRQKITLQDGVPMEKAKEIVRLIKDTKLKVQASIQEDQVRVTGKNKDDLQKVIALCREKDLGIALQFTNYRS